MFLALRELRAARGRVTLMGGTVALITLLLIMLTGLTGGLSKENTSALDSLDPAHLVFSTEEPSFMESTYSGPLPALGVAQTKLDSTGVAVFGLPADFSSPVGSIPSDGLLVPESLGFAAGDTVTLGGVATTVAGVVDELDYSHQPVVWAPTELWQSAAHTDADGTVGLSTDGAEGVSIRDAYSGLPSYSSENGSLLTMQGFLYAISALVTIAFLSVWTIQRTRDLAVLRALGASSRYVLRDSLGQAAMLLAGGVLVGGLLGIGLGTLAAGVLPFDLGWRTLAVPPAGVWLLGIAGAFIATRRVAHTDPLIALGGKA